jgi:hypothetical protein
MGGEPVEPIPDDRPLTATERELLRWLLEHGGAKAAGFLPQLESARVVTRCPCGCASIDFSVGGVTPPAGSGMEVLADFHWPGPDGTPFGIFAYAQAGLLAGLEVWSAGEAAAPSVLPRPDQLEPMPTTPAG